MFVGDSEIGTVFQIFKMLGAPNRRPDSRASESTIRNPLFDVTNYNDVTPRMKRTFYKVKSPLHAKRNIIVTSYTGSLKKD